MLQKDLYRKISGDLLPHNAGCQGFDGSWESRGCEGIFLYGPYWHLETGKYTAVLSLRRLPGSVQNLELVIDIATDQGETILDVVKMRENDLPLRPIPIFMDFDLLQPATVEVRVTVEKDALIAAHELVIYKRVS